MAEPSTRRIGREPRQEPRRNVAFERLPAGTSSRYSIASGAFIIASSPGEVSAQAAHGWRGVTIGVKREPASRGGSASMHAQLKAGDLLEVSRPKNHFRLANSGGADS